MINDYRTIFRQLKSFENILLYRPFHGGSEVIGFPAIFMWRYSSAVVDHAGVEKPFS